MADQAPLLLRLQTDVRLARLAACGQAAAFAVLAERHRPALLRAARRLGGGPQAEDLVQATLLEAWRALAAGTAVANPRAWLFAILRHQLAAGAQAPRAVALQEGLAD